MEGPGETRPILQPEESLERTREDLAALSAPSPFIDALRAAAGGAVTGMISGPGAALLTSFTAACLAWTAGRGTAIALERLQDVTWRLLEEVARMQAQGIRIRWEEDSYLELVNRVLPLAIDTRAGEKRRRFAALLANAAPATDEDREVARTMAILLDQLDEQEVLLLDRIVKASLPESETHERLGTIHHTPLPAIGYDPAVEGLAWVRLHSIGLLSGGMEAEWEVEGQGYQGPAVIVTPLGATLHRWISEAV